MFCFRTSFWFQSVCFIGQLVVAKVLSRLYADMLLYSQSIVYYEHCVSVSRELKDKKLEGEYLEILSSIYLSLNTEKWAFLLRFSTNSHRLPVFIKTLLCYLEFFIVRCRSSRKSLDYSKQSLRISIDLGKREEESETWLQVGRIYYLIHEDELADMYLQVRRKDQGRVRPYFPVAVFPCSLELFVVSWNCHSVYACACASLPHFDYATYFDWQAAVKTALRMNDHCFAMNIYEEAGDVYFKGVRNRMASLPFYRVRGCKTKKKTCWFQCNSITGLHFPWQTVVE